MAELPEIEIARRDLDKDVGGRKIKGVEVPGAKRVVDTASTKKAFSASLEGRKITAIMPEHPVTDGIRSVLDDLAASYLFSTR